MKRIKESTKEKHTRGNIKGKEERKVGAKRKILHYSTGNKLLIKISFTR